MRRWFLPEVPDVLGTLGQQAEQTVAGLESFLRWSQGDAAQEQAVREAEHAADGLRRRLQQELRAAYSTPLDAEDIYELSERLDTVLNAAKDAVREAELLNLDPDTALAEMAQQVLDGAVHLRAAFEALPGHPEAADAAADAAIKCERNIERLYRVAMSQLHGRDDIGEVVSWREMYRRYARMGEALVSVAERVWYATFKQA